jgi:hypothetical protein
MLITPKQKQEESFITPNSLRSNVFDRQEILNYDRQEFSRLLTISLPGRVMNFAEK